MTYDCVELESKVNVETIVLLVGLITYFTLKVSCMVTFLHTFARKIVFDER